MKRINKLYEAKAILKNSQRDLDSKLHGLKLSTSDLKKIQDYYRSMLTGYFLVGNMLQLMIDKAEGSK